VALNRHIAAAEGHANNMRLYEATGVGTCLLTDRGSNLGELFEVGREVIDTVRRLPDEPAFALRERAMPRWASTVAHSLLGLPDSARVKSLRERCRAAGERDLHVQRRILLLEEHALRPSWAQQHALDCES
jgi:hypothetical protein